MQLQSKQDLHTNQKLALTILKNKKLPNKTQPQVTLKPQNNSPLLNVVFCWTSKIILLASWSHSK